MWARDADGLAWPIRLWSLTAQSGSLTCLLGWEIVIRPKIFQEVDDEAG